MMASHDKRHSKRMLARIGHPVADTILQRADSILKGQISAIGKAILVVDDNQDICGFMRVALEGAGYEVRTAEEGAQALVRQQERPANLLITDIFMPVLEGFETIVRFKPEFPLTRIIAMSAGSSSGMKHDYLSTAGLLGVNATLCKPFDAQKLLDVVSKVLAPRPQEGR